MKRHSNLYSKIYDMDNLKLAHRNARKGKTWYKEVKMVVDFVGYRFFFDYTLLRKSTCVNFKNKVRAIQKKFLSNGEISFSDWCSANSYKGWLKWCDSYRLNNKYIAPLEPLIDGYYKKHIKRKVV